MNFVTVIKTDNKTGTETTLIPDYKYGMTYDEAGLMVRGGAFYAVWDQDKGLWSRNERDVIRIIDSALRKEADKYKGQYEKIHVKYASRFGNNSWVQFRKYVKNHPDSYIELDKDLTFADTPLGKIEEHRSKRLPYSLKEGDHSAWSTLVTTLYDEDERRKIEWAIGSIISGDSKTIQKFIVLYGKGGTGKSTIINIIKWLFEGYTANIDADALTSGSAAFATSMLREHPLVAIQHEADLSKINKNTKLNSIVAHEETMVNEKYVKEYTSLPDCLIFLATNTPIMITDAKSGLIRRLIDVEPSGRTLPTKLYNDTVDQIKFQLGAIAYHCLEVYRSMGKHFYDKYSPKKMRAKTDPFYNFVIDNYTELSAPEGISLKNAYAIYKKYCEESGGTIREMYKFREELMNYYDRFKLTHKINGRQFRSYFLDFKTAMFQEDIPTEKSEEEKKASWLSFDSDKSLLDDILAECPAQYAPEEGGPLPSKWGKVTTKLKDLDTTQLHHVNIPTDMKIITYDFDIPDEEGHKSLELNIEAASKMPPTYAELSKSGQGIHLEYYYDGDQSKIRQFYAPHIEIKTSVGNSSLRRRVSRCNTLPIATLTSGVPLKEEKMVDFTTIKDEKHLINLIERNLQKKIVPSTHQSVIFIMKDLEAYYKSGRHYDVRFLKNKVLVFANNSTNHAAECVKMVCNMKFCSDDVEIEDIEDCSSLGKDGPDVFFDCEVFPNLFLICWKVAGEGKPVNAMVNPKPDDLELFMRMNLIGYNCRRYDNHIVYAAWLGYTPYQLYLLSQRIISGDKDAFIGDAYNLSKTDVYDFLSVKQSLKKWELDLNDLHKECPYRWDEEVPENKWDEVIEYCKNDVIATEHVFNANVEDWEARKLLAKLTGKSLNTTTNALTQAFIFGNDRSPQSKFNYRNLGDCSGPLTSYKYDPVLKKMVVDQENFELDYENIQSYTVFNTKGQPVFPLYSFIGGRSSYRNEEIGEGGYVYSQQGMYWHIALLDISSMHPSSIIAEQLFGEEGTKKFQEIRDCRVLIKHMDWANARKALNGALVPTLEGIEDRPIEEQEAMAESLSHALKIMINAVYGLTSAKFPNVFKDPRNTDNIVAKRGELFMINLKNEVMARGYTVAHIKTDSIKIPDYDQDIVDFVMAYGKLYGYDFELESVYDRMCLVNKSVYVAHCESGKHAGEWITTGAQFQDPYIKKSLFTHEPIEFKDLCRAKQVKSSMYLDMNENLGEDEHNYVFIGRFGNFCPMKDGAGGGLLLRTDNDKYDAVVGTKGTRWLESSVVQNLGLEDQINIDFYKEDVETAINDISKYGDFEAFRAIA